ncbi:MAG: Hvo_1808 family surface protein [Salinirussus sp.]
MRAIVVLGVVVLMVCAGCAAPVNPSDSTTRPGSDTAAGQPAGMATADDPAEDRLGWEDGYWHNATLTTVDPDDGFSADERHAVLARAKARVEYLRGLEFAGDVDFSIRSRSNLSTGSGDPSAALRRFDNAKFEALFLVGGETDSIETQSEARNESIAGYYSPAEDAIVLVSDSSTPTLRSERTLAHELVHALQDQHFNLSALPAAKTRDAHNGRNGLLEGDPTAVEQAYMERCGAEWSCVHTDTAATDGGGSNPSSPHLGVFMLQFFPYSDGPDFVEAVRAEGDWATVNDAYGNPPDTAAEVINPAAYPDFSPRNVSLTDSLRNGWERVRPPNRADHGTLGQSALAAAFGYTIYDDYNESAVLTPEELLNLGPGGVDSTDPIKYDPPPVRGWTGDRIHVYHRNEATAYRWRLTWESASAATRFLNAYQDLLRHWGGKRTDAGDWRLPAESPFAGAYHIDRVGEVVTVAHADSPGTLADISPAAR